jgi:hypothetical protein
MGPAGEERASAPPALIPEIGKRRAANKVGRLPASPWDLQIPGAFQSLPCFSRFNSERHHSRRLELSLRETETTKTIKWPHRPIIRSNYNKHIRVTQRDIDRGLQGYSFGCPVALAVRRAFKADTVWVREIIIVTKGRSQQTYVTPPEVEYFLESYYSAILEFESPRPFSFTLGARPLPGVNAVKAGKGITAR